MPQKLYGIQVHEFQHPADKEAMELVKKTPGFSKIGEALQEFERNYQDELLFYSTYIKLDRTNANRIITLFEEVCDIFEYENNCQLFSYQSFGFKLDVGGIKEPIIKIPRAMLERFSDDQFRFVFGQIVTMLKARYLLMFSLAKGLVNSTGGFPIIGDVMRAPVGHWYRKMQPTIDRGGLLACQNFDAAMHYLMLLAGLPYNICNEIDVYDYVEEISKNYETKKDLVSTYGHISQTLLKDRRAWANERIVELFSWHENGQYETIMSRHT